MSYRGTSKNYTQVGFNKNATNVSYNNSLCFWLRLPFNQQDGDNTPVLIIGANNVFEVDCTVEACKIGDNNVFESKCFVSNKVTVTNGCIIGAGCRLTEEQTLKENIIVYGENCHMREGMDPPVVSVIVLLLPSSFSCWFDFIPSLKRYKWIH